MSDCQHNYLFAATVYKDGGLRPGTDARDRIYSDRMVCSKCLDVKDIKPRNYGNTFERPIAGTVPA